MADYKKMEQDQMDAHAKMVERQKQAILNNDYKRVMAEHQQKQMKEKMDDLMIGQKANQRANMENQFFKQAEIDKKQMIKGILKSGYGAQDQKDQ